MKHRFFALILLIHISSSFAAEIESRIIESTNISDILQYIQSEKTLVLTDLDNTVITHQHQIGGDFWFEQKVKSLTSTGMTYQEALTEVLPKFFELQEKVNLELVEGEKTLQTFAEINKRCHCIGLTARSVCLAQRTISELSRLGITLHDAHNTLGDGTTLTKLPKENAHYAHIMFVSQNDKGKAAVAYLATRTEKPDMVVYAEDKEKYAKQVTDAFAAEGIPCVCIRYGRLDEIGRNFKLIDVQNLCDSTVQQ